MKIIRIGFLAPEFIASFDVGSNIYFFFREKAEEQRDIFPKIYSRVGRLCKVKLFEFI